MDPRWFQIATLTGLLLYGVVSLDFEVDGFRILLVLTSVLGTQWLAGRWAGLSRTEYCSAWISGLSLCLLARADHWLWLPLLGAVAVASKFLLRWNGKHVFNPTNLALALGLGVSGGQVWISPGQWGSVAILAFLFVCMGGLVVTRARRADVALAFLACWAGLLLGRTWWLGDPWTIPWHRLQNGALLLFAFFMISDPKTTPNSRAGRLTFAALVAISAWWWQFHWYHNNGLIWSLALWSLAVPLLDRWLPGSPYEWHGGASPPTQGLANTDSLSFPEFKPGMSS